MTIQALENLADIKQLHREPPDQNEFNGMVRAADIKLRDVQLAGLSVDSQFSLAYSAAHSLALAALRWHGYRSDARYLVFQCLQHTLGLENVTWRLLDKCQKCRNLAEYEGHVDVDAQLLKELINIANDLQARVRALPAIKPD